MKRSSNVGTLANIALLERELGGITYRLHRGAGSAERRDLESRQKALLVALDAEQDKLARGADA